MWISSRNSLLRKNTLLKAGKLIQNLINFKKKLSKVKDFKKVVYNQKIKLSQLYNVNIEYLELRNEKNLKVTSKTKNSKLFIAFYLDKISNYCEKYSRDPSCYDFDILPTYCTIKNLDPVPDMIMYGAGGDEMMLHKSRAMQSQVFQMLWDENKNDILKRYNDYLNSHQHTYSAKRNILGTVGFQTLEEQYSSLEWEKYQLAIWDNRSMLHQATTFKGNRVMHRITIN